MYEFLPPLTKYILLAALYLFIFLAYLGTLRVLRAAARAEKAPEQPRARTPRLVVVRRGESSTAVVGQEFVLLHDTVIGRDPTSTIVVPDEYASKLHARVYADRGAFVLADQGSRNGTFLNGKRLSQPTELVPGDKIQIGTTTFEYRE